MLLANAPGKLTTAFATTGNKNTIPVSTATPGAASWNVGFPPLTMVDPTQGGIGPSGLDFNGIFNALSALNLWFNAGAGFVFDATFATAAGGYPIGARVLRADHSGYWISTVDNNTSNPDTGGAGWMLEGNRPCASVFASASQALAVGNAKVLFDTVEFDTAGLWDATNKRFKAIFAGKYRISGVVTLTNPAGQNLAVQIWHNGVFAKQGACFPQVSDMTLGYTFDAIINCAVGDFLEAFMNITLAQVQAGIVGNNEPYVYAQCEYIGA